MTTVLTEPSTTRTACCGDAVPTSLSDESAASLARVLRALADPVRLRLVAMIAAHEGGEACVCDLTAPLGLAQPTVSHHLKVLTDAGFLSRSKRGTWAFYALVPGALDAVADGLRTV